MKLKLYLTPSIFVGYFEKIKLPALAALFDLLNKEEHFGFYSLLTLYELKALPSPLKEDVLNLMTKTKLYECEYDLEEVAELVDAYLAEKILPAEMEFSLCHVAIATVSEMDIFVSLDTTYSANQFLYQNFKKVNQKLGYGKTPEMRLPEEITGILGPYENLKFIYEIRKKEYTERKAKNTSLLEYLRDLHKQQKG
uniref:PIN domain-containing protein n=1 Tax=candidate division WOR-3 bacterium TaxID=2052148 RepID=A0A7V5XZ63_UNCW3